MLKIKCEDYAQVRAFKTGGKAWDNAISLVDEWQKEYDFEKGCKDLFYSLLQTGSATTVLSNRAELVSGILKEKGYKPSIHTLKVIELKKYEEGKSWDDVKVYETVKLFDDDIEPYVRNWALHWSTEFRWNEKGSKQVNYIGNVKTCSVCGEKVEEYGVTRDDRIICVNCETES